MLRGSSQLVSDLSGVSDVPYMWPTSHREVGNKLATSWRQLNYGFVTNKLATSRESRGETTFVECGHKFRSITLARLAASISRVSVCPVLAAQILTVTYQGATQRGQPTR